MIFRFQICSVLLTLYMSCVHHVIFVQYVCIIINMISELMVSCMIMSTIIMVLLRVNNFCLCCVCLIKDNSVLLDLLPQHCKSNIIHVAIYFRTNNLQQEDNNILIGGERERAPHLIVRRKFVCPSVRLSVCPCVQFG